MSDGDCIRCHHHRFMQLVCDCWVAAKFTGLLVDAQVYMQTSVALAIVSNIGA